MNHLKKILRYFAQLILYPYKFLYGYYCIFIPSKNIKIVSPTFKQLNAARYAISNIQIKKWAEIFNDLNFKENDLIIDVGGNLGYTSLQYYYATRTTARIMTFEPYIPNIKYIERNLSSTNIEIITLGLGDKNEKISIGFPEYTEEISNNDDKNNTGRVSMINLSERVLSEKQSSCLVFKLDDLSKIFDIEKLFFIKVDIEGFETNFLKGADNLINSQRPILYMEINPTTLSNPKDDITFIKDFFENKNYNFYAYNKLIKSKINDEFKRTDLFFIPSEIDISSDSKLKKFTFE